MSASITIDLKAVSQDWARLRESSHLGPIRTEEDYEKRVILLNTLLDTVGDDEHHPLAGLLELVGDLVQSYDSTHYEIESAKPSELLRYLMDEHGLRQTDLSDIGSQGVVSELLSGKRVINARQAKLLGMRFKVSPAVFL